MLSAPAHPQPLRARPALYLSKRRLSAGRHTVTVTLPGRPALAGVDPRYLLLTQEKEEIDARMASVHGAP